MQRNFRSHGIGKDWLKSVSSITEKSVGGLGRWSELPLLEAREDLTGPVMVIIGDAVAGASLEESSALALNNNLVQEKFTGAVHVR